MTSPAPTSPAHPGESTGYTVTPERAVRSLHHDVNERPMIVIWEVTRACQLVCKHCRADAQHQPHPEQLTTAQGKRLLDDIASFGRPFPIVILTGGDCFERTDLTEIVSHGTEIGLHMAISPSATPKVTQENLQAIHRAGANALSLSIDGACAESHDAWRGVPGVYDKTIQAANWARDEGIRVQVNTTVIRENIEELPAILGNVIDLHAHLWSVFFLVPTGRGTRLTAVSADEAEDIMHWLHDCSDLLAVKTTEAQHFRRVAIQRARVLADGGSLDDIPHGPTYARLRELSAGLLNRTTLPTRRPRPPIDINSGRGFAFIDHRGDVYPSGFLPHLCGNVTETAFPEIYRTSELLKSLRRPWEFHGKCGVCEFNEVCGGSRSHAYAVTGDILASDPTCAYVPPGMAQVAERPNHTAH